MTTFEETLHPRAGDGTFAEKPLSPAEVALPHDEAAVELNALTEAAIAIGRPNQSIKERDAARKALDSALANYARAELRRAIPGAAMAAFVVREETASVEFLGTYDSADEWIKGAAEHEAANVAAGSAREILVGGTFHDHFTPLLQGSNIFTLHLDRKD